MKKQINYMDIRPKPMSDLGMIVFLALMGGMMLLLIIGVTHAYLENLPQWSSV